MSTPPLPSSSGPRRPTLSRRAAWRHVAAGSIAAGSAVALDRRAVGSQVSEDSAVTDAAARRALAAINWALATGDMGRLNEAFAASYVNHTPPRSRTTGRLVSPDLAGFTASLTELRAAVPDAVLIFEDVIAAADTAAVRVRFRGTLAPAGTDGTPASGHRLDLGAAAFGRIESGLVIESWNYAEIDEVLGACPVPTPEQADTATEEPGAALDRGEVRAVREFDDLSLDGVGMLVLTQGDTESLTIEAEPHVLARIETVVEAGTLFIRPDESFETDEPIRYDLRVKQLNRLEVAGATQVEASRLSASSLSLEVRGTGEVAIDALVVTALDIAAAGSAEVVLAGTTDRQTVRLSDASHYAAEHLTSRLAVVTVESAAQATVAVSELLEARVSGAGSISYFGNPVVHQEESGAGSVSQVE